MGRPAAAARPGGFVRAHGPAVACAEMRQNHESYCMHAVILAVMSVAPHDEDRLAVFGDANKPVGLLVPSLAQHPDSRWYRHFGRFWVRFARLEPMLRGLACRYGSGGFVSHGGPSLTGPDGWGDRTKSSYNAITHTTDWLSGMTIFMKRPCTPTRSFTIARNKVSSRSRAFIHELLHPARSPPLSVHRIAKEVFLS
jgi:hypothetical protein